MKKRMGERRKKGERDEEMRNRGERENKEGKRRETGGKGSRGERLRIIIFPSIFSLEI